MNEQIECTECGVTHPVQVCWADGTGQYECPECGQMNDPKVVA